MVEVRMPSGTSRDIHRGPSRDRGLVCERCSGKLLYDGENLTCLMCGYEAVDDDRVRRGRTNPAEMLDALVRFRSELSHFVEAIGQKPLPGSPAEREVARAEVDEAVALGLVPCFAYQSMFAAGHALIALARGLEPPAPEYGTWATSNAVLQAAGLVRWLLDEDLCPAERALRALAIEGHELAAEAGVMLAASDAHGAFANSIAANRARSAQLAGRLGQDGPCGLPTPLDLAEEMDSLSEYRMFASIVAGRPWALLQATSMAGSFGVHPSGAVAAIQVTTTATWYARATWTFARWMLPAPAEDLCGSLERGYDAIGLPDNEQIRFWRSIPPTAPRSARSHVTASARH